MGKGLGLGSDNGTVAMQCIVCVGICLKILIVKNLSNSILRRLWYRPKKCANYTLTCREYTMREYTMYIPIYALSRHSKKLNQANILAGLLKLMRQKKKKTSHLHTACTSNTVHTFAVGHYSVEQFSWQHLQERPLRASGEAIIKQQPKAYAWLP